MLSRISAEEMSSVLGRARRRGLITPDHTSIIFYDLSRLKDKIKELTDLFPANTLHAVAIKANPLTAILKHLCQLGAGAEAASLPELHLAEKAGFKSEKIVFDSPVKTVAELEHALRAGVHVNVDSFQELQRIEKLQKRIPTKSRIGVRLNPQVGEGKIAATSVAGTYSKFGIPLNPPENRKQLIDSFLKYEWLRGVHLHVGSQGCDVELLLRGIELIADFARETNERLETTGAQRRIDIFDIGGGLPVAYRHDDQAVGMAEYKQRLVARCPSLFDGRFSLITEFGRYIHAHTGWVAARVEYVKHEDSLNTAMIHVGADMFLRECYHPEDWHHDITVVDQSGKAKSGAGKTYVLAGPLCFAGDIIEKEIRLPEVAAGDYLLIHDAGAYTLSMWSRHNSRQIPRVVGYYDNGEDFEIIKERESLSDLWDFWS
jgi:diaminopimelate decarboxylase